MFVGILNGVLENIGQEISNLLIVLIFNLKVSLFKGLQIGISMCKDVKT